MRKHFRDCHLPYIFFEEELDNWSLDAPRIAAIGHLRELLLGPQSTFAELVSWVNNQGIPEEATISEADQALFRDLARRYGWETPNHFTLVPVNSRALLLHWRPLLVMICGLSVKQRNQWWSRQKGNLSRKKSETATAPPEDEVDSEGSIPPHEMVEMDAVGYGDEDEIDPPVHGFDDGQREADENFDQGQYYQPGDEAAAVSQEPSAMQEREEAGPVAFDSHFHLDRSSRWILHKDDGTLEELLEARSGVQPAVDVQGGVAVFCDPDCWPNQFGIMPGFGAAVGVHPKKATEFTDEHFSTLEELLKREGVVALGEVGLDHTVDESMWQRQEEVLRQVLLLSYPLRPLVVHVRAATEQETGMLYAKLYSIFRECVMPTQRIHLHCFTGSAEQVVAWKEAFPYTYFGFTNMVRNFSRNQRAGLRQVPRDRILIETDAPYFGGERGTTPIYLGTAALAVSQVIEGSLEDVVRLTTGNGRTLYRM